MHDPALVPRAAAAALGLLETAAREPEASLADYLASSAALVVLDNCERVLDGAARLVDTVLPASSRLRVLATSRAPLGVGAERVLDGAAAIRAGRAGTAAGQRQGDEALMLFEERAAAVVPGFRLGPHNQDAVVRLCRRLDGFPLAIELAAVRLRVLSAEQMLDRLEDRFQLLTGGKRDGPARHQTLQAAVEWSFDLCSEPERQLWARCSVFAGEFDLDAAEAVCAGDSLDARDVLAESRSWSISQCWHARPMRAAGPGTGCWKPSASSARSGWPARVRPQPCDAAIAITTCCWQSRRRRLLRPASGPVGQAAAGRPGEPLGGA